MRRLLIIAAALLAVAPLRAETTPQRLIFISIDTLRPDRLGCYGHDRPTSPNIDRLAARGLRFADASAPSPWTKPSHASMFTGLYPARHGADRMQGSLNETVPTLAERMKKQGFQTAAFVNATWLKMQGLERGFDKHDWIAYEQGEPTPSPVSDRTIAWLKQRKDDEKLFLFVHYMDVHSDYTAEPEVERQFVRPYDGEFDGTTQQLYAIAEGKLTPNKRDVAHLLDRYDAGIRQTDQQLGRLLDHLKQRGWLESSWIILTSDHGEEFLEHGSATHGHTQFEEVLQVPLLISGPGVPKKTVSHPVSLVDLVPTLEQAFQLPTAFESDGRPLQQVWQTNNAPLRLQFGEADVTFPPPGPGLVPPGPHRAVRYGDLKLHVDLKRRDVRLYDLSSDPGETNDLAEQRPDTTRLLLRKLQQHIKGSPGSCELTAEERRTLQ